jgi:hypothetical protein
VVKVWRKRDRGVEKRQRLTLSVDITFYHDRIDTSSSIGAMDKGLLQLTKVSSGCRLQLPPGTKQ